MNPNLTESGRGFYPAASPSPTPQPFPVIVWGGLAAAVLDTLDALVAYGLLGKNPVQVLQYVASGAFGVKSYQGGLLTAGAGAVFHFFIAFVVAAIFYLGCRLLPGLARHYVVSGLLYGAAVFGVMTYLILPFTALPPSPPSLALLINGFVGHAVFVGLPIAWFAHYSRKLPSGKTVH